MKESMRKIMVKAWMMVRKYGYNMSEALKKAWAWAKLVNKMRKGVVEFRFVKVDGSIRQAFGSLKEGVVPSVGESGRKANETIQTYWDCEKSEWRCFKVVNLIVE